MIDPNVDAGQNAERVQSLLKFAAGVLTARERVQMRMADTRLGVFREEEIASLPGVAVDGGDGEWLRVKRQQESLPQAPATHVRVFLETDGSDPSQPPSIKAVLSLVVPIEEASDLAEAGFLRPESVSAITEKGVLRADVVRVALFATDFPEMRLDYDRWCVHVWEPWAAREQPIRTSIALYNALFRIHATIHAAEGVPPEIVWGFGIGLLAKDSVTIDMPLIEQEVEIEVLSGGDLILMPRDRPMDLSLKPYLELEIPGSARLQSKLAEALSAIRQGDIDVSPTDFSILEAIFASAASELDSGGHFFSRLELSQRDPKASEHLQILSRWAIYVRPRSAAARVQDLERLAQKVEASGRPPMTLKGFVAPEPDQKITTDPFGLDIAVLGATKASMAAAESLDDDRGIRVDSEAPAGTAAGATYFFPLPFNAEQAAIINALEGRKTGRTASVVSVTGPPGTGKSHTIANLVAHAMACGKRVLVTARTSEAITVVREKLPKVLQPLVIASTGTDRESIEQLKAAVTHLSDEIATLDVTAAQIRRQVLEAQIAECDQIAKASDQELARIARVNLKTFELDGVQLTPMLLAPRVAEGRAAYGWFTDRPHRAPGKAVARAVADLQMHLPTVAADLEITSVVLPNPADVPSVASLLDAHEEEKIQHNRPILDASAFPPMAVNTDADIGKARELLASLKDIDVAVKALDDRGRILLDAFVAATGAHAIRDSLEALQALDLTEAMENVRYGREVPLPLLTAAAVRGASGQNPAPGLFNRSLKAAVQSVTIGGAPVSAPEAWRISLATMKLEAQASEIAVALESLPQGTNWTSDASQGWEWARAFRALRAAVGHADDLARRLAAVADVARELFPVGIDISAVRRGEVTDLALAIEAHAPEARNPNAAKEKLEDFGRRSAHSVFARMAMLAEALGKSDISPEMLVRERTEITKELARLRSLVGSLATVDAAFATLEDAGAQDWVARLKAAPEEAARSIPENWEMAWRWAITARFLDTIVAMGNGDAMRTRKAEALRRRGRLMEELIKVRTMLGLKARMTSSVQRAMQAFTQAVARVGKGTGKTAPRYRAAAQRAAQEVAVAAPVWIMPEHRIAEQLPPDIEAFDLVILDEASQSDVTAVAALVRGKQVLVVGDEEQVSPSNVGIPRQKIDALRAEHLAGLPNADLIDENTSIFEITMRMHPETHEILREHFRSVAPIISFSAQFYQNRLIPLRVAKPSERFDPPLVDVLIENAERRGKTNPSEARWIVEEIATLVADQAHSIRDIGIVSLIGSDQARLIETLLLEDDRIGPEVMRARRIICGDARTMQGQERSVMFLSMVATPQTVVSQTTKDFQQRLNVAMSRARDRVYLVRSLRDRNLKTSDLKLKVLRHFEDPMPEGHKIVARELMDRCESGFEREVLGRLLDAGYRATPQVPAGAYRIDIVVEGADDRRLAIELDGDAYHGPDRWAEDMARQAALERAGWIFWRVFGSQWETEKDRWWQHLVKTLNTMGIAPIGGAARFESFVEFRVTEGVTVPQPFIVSEATSVAPTQTEGDGLPVDLDANEFHDPAPENYADMVASVAHAYSAPRDSVTEQAAAIQSDLFGRPIVGNLEIRPGFRVTIEMDDGEQKDVTVVRGTADPDLGRILVTSPLGEALLGAAAGEEVEFAVGDVLRSVKILSVLEATVA